MFDHECTIDVMLHDLANFCFDHDCSGEKLLENEMKNKDILIAILQADEYQNSEDIKKFI